MARHDHRAFCKLANKKNRNFMIILFEDYHKIRVIAVNLQNDASREFLLNNLPKRKRGLGELPFARINYTLEYSNSMETISLSADALEVSPYRFWINFCFFLSSAKLVCLEALTRSGV